MYDDFLDIGNKVSLFVFVSNVLVHVIIVVRIRKIVTANWIILLDHFVSHGVNDSSLEIIKIIKGLTREDREN